MSDEPVFEDLMTPEIVAGAATKMRQPTFYLDPFAVDRVLALKGGLAYELQKFRRRYELQSKAWKRSDRGTLCSLWLRDLAYVFDVLDQLEHGVEK